MARILIVDDEEKMRGLIRDFLEVEGYEINEAKDGKEALSVFEAGRYDLLILDVMMPGLDGWTLARRIRKTSQVPIMMVTAKDEDSDQVLGFELGVDEYVTKPFNPSILTARVKALLKRTAKTEGEGQESDFRIDEEARKAFLHGEELSLTPKEYDLLIYLYRNENIALSREQILDGVWGFDYFGGLRTVDTHIKRLRLKLKEGSEMIGTVRGYGYRFEVKR